MARIASRWCLALTLVVGASGWAQAGFLVLNQSGAFGPTSTLDGAAFGADTSFSYRAIFDTTPATIFDPGQVLFNITALRIEIAGRGVFTSSPGADIQVFLGDPSVGGEYFAGITNAAVDAGFAPFYAQATPAFAALSPTPTVFSGLFDTGAAFPFVIDLAGGHRLVVNDLGNRPIASSITAVPVPEPSSLTLCGIGVAVGAGLWRRRREGAAEPGAAADGGA